MENGYTWNLTNLLWLKSQSQILMACLEYYLKDNPHRQFIHYSKVKPITDYNLISELEKNYSGETGLLG